MKFDDFSRAIWTAGWRPECDAQYDGLKNLHRQLFPDVAELEDVLDEIKQRFEDAEAQGLRERIAEASPNYGDDSLADIVCRKLIPIKAIVD